MRSATCSLRILLIDDDEDARQLLTILLELIGYEVYSESNGRSALPLVESLHPDVIISDIGMPELDGYQTAALIRRQSWGSQVVLIALSGYGSAQDKKRADQAGFDYHFTKPLDTRLLNQALKKHLLFMG